ncbi:PilN domain-containing protein [Desulfoluna sp.]|uniref:PilN domain-containing protein n=1 Tax=Desulfoluna sp. TaxID=2045199 RepID=UPI002615A124|nr:PilN domain-containing protein [Desulfoluna sp.]
MKLTGIEITEEGAAAVTVERQSGALRVTACRRVSRGALSSDTGASADDSELLAALGRALTDPGEKVAVVLPAAEMWARRAHLPFRDSKTIDKALPFELEPTLPVPLEGLRIIWESRAAGDGDSEIIALIGEEKGLEKRRLQLKAVGMEPMVLAPSAVASALTLARNEDAFFLTLRRVNRTCTLAVVCDRKLVFLRVLELPAGDGVETMTREVWQTLVALAEGEGRWTRPEKILVSGWDDFPETLKTPLGTVPVEGARLLSATGAVLEEEVKPQWEDGPYNEALAVACSALCGWKYPVFWRQGFAPIEFIGKHKKRVFSTGGLVLVLLLLLVARAVIGVEATHQQLVAVEKKMAGVYLATLSDEKRAPGAGLLLRSIEGRVRVAKEEAIYAGQGAVRVRVIDILKAISTHVPSDLKVSLTRMTLAKGKLTVSGLAEDFGAIDTLKGALEKSVLFTGVTIASSSKESGGDLFQFKVVIALSGEEAS